MNTVAQVKADVAAALHGTTANQIAGFDSMLYRAASSVVDDIDPEETRRTVPLATSVFPDIYDYSCPADLKGSRIIDLRPRKPRHATDGAYLRYSQDFDRQKSSMPGSVMAEVRNNNGVKSLRLAVPSTDSVLIDGFDSDAGWTGTGGATSLVTDSNDFVEGTGSLRFSANGSSVVSKSISPSIDLTAHRWSGGVFCQVKLPTSFTLASVAVRIGSDSSNYFTASVSSAFDGTVFKGGWQQLGWLWESMASVGSPDISKIGYAALIFTFTGSAVPVYADWLFSAAGVSLELEYYSRFLFVDGSTGAFKERPTANTDLLNLEGSSYMLYFAKLMQFAVQQQQGENMAADLKVWKEEYEDRFEDYAGKNPSQAIKAQQTFYRVRKRNPGQLVGRPLTP
jgi:hypothetical protein